MKANHSASIIFILLLSISIISNAQELNNMVGIQGGVNFSTLEGNSQIGFQTKTGFSGGLFYERKTEDELALRVEINYEIKGTQSLVTLTDNFGNTIGQYTAYFDFDYLTIPVLVKYYFGNGKTRFFINAGPYIGYLLQQTIVNPEGVNGLSVNIDNTKDFSRIDAGISAGAGINIPFSDDLCLSVEARENYGLVKLSGSSAPIFTSFSHQSLIGFVGVAYHF